MFGQNKQTLETGIQPFLFFLKVHVFFVTNINSLTVRYGGKF